MQFGRSCFRQSAVGQRNSEKFHSTLQAIALGLVYGDEAYFKSGWNALDGSLVITSMVDLIMTVIMGAASKIFGILRVFRLVRALRPLRVINRAPGLKLVVQGGFTIVDNYPLYSKNTISFMYSLAINK